MNTKPPTQPAADPSSAVSAEAVPVPSGPRPDWHRPELTRIEIRRTMAASLHFPTPDLES
jgi:hypothetical protein